jgi:hypothetical protein
MGGLERPEFTDELVVVGVGDGRSIELVVRPVVGPDAIAQELDPTGRVQVRVR